MSQRPERLRRISRHIPRAFTGLAAGLRGFMPRSDRVKTAFARGAIDPAEAPAGPPEGGVKAADTSAEAATSGPETGGRLARPPLERPPEKDDDTEGGRRRMEAASGGDGDEPPWRHADAAPGGAAAGAAGRAREGAAGGPAAGTPEGATPAAAATLEPAVAPDPPRPAGARPVPGPPDGASPATTAAPVEAAGRGLAERAPEPPPRGASPGHGQVGDLRDRVDQVVNDQARIAQQLLQLGDRAGAAWRAAQEVAGQLRQVNRSALKR
jgi:hypothetical protein